MKIHHFSLSCLSTIVFSVIACSCLVGSENLASIAAIVDNEIITEGELDEQFQLFVLSGIIRPEDSLKLDSLRLELLTELINRRILIEYAQQESIEVLPEEVEEMLENAIDDITSRFPSEEAFLENLKKEGITDQTWIVGDVMFDASLFYRELIERGEVVPNLRLTPPNGFYLLTLHRAENTDDSERLASIVGALNSLTDFPSVFPIHPRTRKAISFHGLAFESHIEVIEPVGFFEMLELERMCSFVVTDSGGVQKEAFFFGKPCITLRGQTEWIETVSSGWNVLVDSDEERIRSAFYDIRVPDERPMFYGDGCAGSRILKILISQLSE